MKQASHSVKNELSEMVDKVLGVFQELNKVQIASKVQLFDLIKFFKEDPPLFQ